MLLGTANGNKLVLASFRIKDNRVFSADFDEVGAFIATDEYCEDRAQNWVESLGFEEENRLLKEFDCKPSNLAKELMKRRGQDFAIDTSLYPEIFYIPEISENDIMFKSLGCGQNDPRDIEGFKPIYPEFSEYLLSVWDKYYLENIPKIMDINLSNAKLKYYKDFNEYQFIKEWLKTVF